MLNQKKVEIFLAKFHKSPAKQFLEIAFNETISRRVWCGSHSLSRGLVVSLSAKLQLSIVRQPLVVSLTRCLVDLSTCQLVVCEAKAEHSAAATYCLVVL